MSGGKLCSLVTVNWNGGDSLRTLYQTLQKYEDVSRLQVILADNGSSDGSVDMVRREFSFVEVLENGENIGFGAGNNRALPGVKSDLVVFANPDMEFMESGLEKLLDVFRRDDRCAVAGPMILKQDGGFMAQCRRGFPDPVTSFYYLSGLWKFFPRNKKLTRYLHSSIPPEEGMEVDAVSGSFFAARTSAVKEMGGFDENFFLFVEEVELFHRLRMAGWKVRYEPVMKIKHHGGVCFERQPRKRLFYHYHMTRSHIILWAKERVRKNGGAVYHAAFLLALLRYALVSAISLNMRFPREAVEFFRLHGGGLREKVIKEWR